MKTLKNNLALFAAILAVGSAVAMAPAKRTAEVYGRDINGNWVNINSNPSAYSCESALDPCKAYFSSQPAQNEVPASEDVLQDNGYITP